MEVVIGVGSAIVLLVAYGLAAQWLGTIRDKAYDDGRQDGFSDGYREAMSAIGGGEDHYRAQVRAAREDWQ